MVGKLIRLLFAIVVAAGLVGGPAVQAAAVTMPCHTGISVTHSHAVSAPHAPTPAPSKAMMPGCAEMLGCGVSANLRTRVATATQVAWTSVAYWSVPGSLEGLFVEPNLFPPITV